MSKQLIIVESPTKAKTISKFLKGNYDVEASYGHVRDLPKSKISVDVEHDFTPQYEVPPKAEEVIKNLKKKVKDASSIILATDEDREGEAISWHLVQALGLGKEAEIKAGTEDNRIKRIVFHEITEPAIKHALENPRDINLDLVDAQQARRVLDRLVGYELSPFLWRKLRYGLSAGRVQSVAVRLIVEREREINAFNPEEYWSIVVELSKQNDALQFTAKLRKANGQTVGKMDISSKEQAQKIATALQNAEYQVLEVEQKEVKRNPAAPFTTSTLQQEAARKLNMSAKQTMMTAQKLYEKGHITYMRTDSLNLAASALTQAQEVIQNHFGAEFGLKEPRHFTNKSKGAQEAHEAIRPTDLSLLPDQLKAVGIPKGKQLYDLIWKRTLASQMQQAIFDKTAVDIKAGDYEFRATGQVVKFEGFIKVYTEGTDETPEEEIADALPQLSVGESLAFHNLQENQHFTQPPARYTDASLVKALEAHGVGRPSTYAPTLTTIQDRGYAIKEDNKYRPTEEGELVTDMLVAHFPEIIDIDFTSRVEADFDKIASGEIQWVPMIKDFYTPFKQHLEEKEQTVKKLIEVSNTPCPHCQQPMLIKYGRMGKFLACPEEGSKVTKPMPEEEREIAELTAKTREYECPECGKLMDVKRGRFGFFLGCQDYPTCKGISKIWNKTGFKCPLCQETESRQSKPGDLVQKKGRGRSKPFYACTLWPDCDLIINKLPESQEELNQLFTAWKTRPAKDKTTPSRKTATKKRAVSKTARK
ncbi:MAG: type I DNA topoisomerase [Candidatus Doudnabacteria bacterium]